jgi:hypothetical protein
VKFESGWPPLRALLHRLAHMEDYRTTRKDGVSGDFIPTHWPIHEDPWEHSDATMSLACREASKMGWATFDPDFCYGQITPAGYAYAESKGWVDRVSAVRVAKHINEKLADDVGRSSFTPERPDGT